MFIIKGTIHEDGFNKFVLCMCFVSCVWAVIRWDWIVLVGILERVVMSFIVMFFILCKMKVVCFFLLSLSIR